MTTEARASVERARRAVDGLAFERAIPVDLLGACVALVTALDQVLQRVEYIERRGIKDEILNANRAYPRGTRP